MQVDPSPIVEPTERPPRADAPWTGWVAPALVAMTAGWTLATFVTLPDPCPIHFDFHGRVTRTGSRTTVLLLPIIQIVLVVGITLIEHLVTGIRDPEHDLVNVVGPRTERNVRRQLALLLRFLLPLKVLVALIFLVAAVETTLVGWGVRTSLSPAVMLLVGLLVAWTIVGTTTMLARACRITSEETTRDAPGSREGRR